MSDNKLTINCPACGKEMVKVFDENNGINIDICLNGCGGMLFDNREFEKFDEAHENADEILNAIKDKVFEKVDDSKIRICPICKVPMVKMGAGNGGVEIDVCNTCGAKFLDNGELEKVRQGGTPDMARVDSMIELLYQEDLKNIIGDKYVNFQKTSSRRKFFENLVTNYLSK